MIRHLHAAAGAVALLMIALFWLSTALSEVFAGPATVTAVKSLIPWGFLILIPALMAAGGSGLRLGKKRRGKHVEAKRRRMPLIAANGIAILIPSALYLSSKAQAGAFDSAFYTVQAIELIAGAGNILLLALNIRDGKRLTRRAPRAT